MEGKGEQLGKVVSGTGRHERESESRSKVEFLTSNMGPFRTNWTSRRKAKRRKASCPPTLDAFHDFSLQFFLSKRIPVVIMESNHVFLLASKRGSHPLSVIAGG